jgi:hypothetical protein
MADETNSQRDKWPMGQMANKTNWVNPRDRRHSLFNTFCCIQLRDEKLSQFMIQEVIRFMQERTDKYFKKSQFVFCIQ